MSASERLREKFEEAFAWDNTDYWGHVTPAAQIKAALAEIIAVLEAAESHVHFDRRHQRRISTEPIRDALAALDAKLAG